LAIPEYNLVTMKTLFIPFIFSAALVAVGWFIVGPTVSLNGSGETKNNTSKKSTIQRPYFPDEVLDQGRVLNGRLISITGTPIESATPRSGASSLLPLTSVAPEFDGLRGSIIIDEGSIGLSTDAALDHRQVTVTGTFTSLGIGQGIIRVDPACRECVR
jgi:hypothetical protein